MGFSHFLKMTTLALVLGLTGCGYSLHHSFQPLVTPVAELSLPANQITFQMVMATVIKPQCLSCHSSATKNQGGVNLETFENAKALSSAIKRAVNNGSMPKNGSLTAAQKEFFLRWLNAGASEFGLPQSGQGSTTPTPTPEPTIPTTGGTSLHFADIKKEIIDVSCLGCHSAAKQGGGVSLERYADVFKNADDIKSAIEDGSMPKGKPLSAAQKALILEWLNAGAPEKSGVANPTTPPFVVDPVPEHRPTGQTTEEEILERGKYLTNLSGCANCHTLDRAKPFAGGKAIGSSFGTFYSPNISADKETGIGSWSEKDFLKALRHGLNRRNEFYYPAFPFASYSKMNDADLLSIRAYISSMPATKQVNTPHKIPFPFNNRPILLAWRVLNFPFVKNQNAENFRNARGPYQDIAEKDLVWNQGAYLVEGPLHCAMCHTQRDKIGTQKLSLWMGGAPKGLGQEAAPNITPDQSGLKNWSQEDWLEFLNTDHRPTGGRVTGDMKQVITNATSQLTRADQLAVIEYLRSVPPVNH